MSSNYLIARFLLGTASLVLLASGTARSEPATIEHGIKLQTVYEESFRRPVAMMSIQKELQSKTESKGARIGDGLSLDDGTTWLHPVHAGRTADFAMRLDFGTAAASIDSTFSFIVFKGFVFPKNQSILEGTGVSVRFASQDQDGKRVGVIKIQEEKAVRRGSRVSETSTLATLSSSDGPKSGEYLLRFHRGLIVVKRDGVELLRAYSDQDIGRVVGISWDHRGGAVKCRDVRIDGDQLELSTLQLSDRAQSELDDAARLNREATRLFEERKFAESLALMKQASDLYVKVFGEEHDDSANSFTNVATVLERHGQSTLACEYWERALKIRRKLLGDDHPHVAFCQVYLGGLSIKLGKPEAAKTHFQDCLRIFERTYGKESKQAKGMADIVSRL